MGEIDYIDFNYPVRDVRIDKGTRLWGFKDRASRRWRRCLKLRCRFSAFRARPADGIDTWSMAGRPQSVTGGGWQYKIPHAYRYLRYTTPFPQR
jgi:hypothetical protein